MSENTAENSRSVLLTIADMSVTLPLKFSPGHVLTDAQARILDAAYQRQFTNNQNALAKSRAEAYAKATTDAERAAKAPLTADALMALYNDYEPAVGGAPRQSMMEKIRADAAWRMWTALIAEHNDSVSNGGSPVIVRAGSKQIPPLAPIRDPATKKVVSTVAEQREKLSARILTMPEYADKVQVQIDAIMAERGTKVEVAPAADTVAMDDLF